MTNTDILGDPICPAHDPPLSGVQNLFAAPPGLDRMGAVKTSTRQRAFEICEWSAKQGRPLYVLWGKVSNPKNTEHYGGYGVDFMTFSNAALTKHDRAIGDGIVEHMLANRVRLNLKGLIWQQRRIGYSDGWDRWVNMADRGSSTANHRDHVHGLFGPGDYVPPGPVVKLPTYYVDPAKVSTALTANAPAGKHDLQREPGFAITTAVAIDGKWLVTAAGYRYHIDYLTTTKPVITSKPTPPKPEPAPVTTHTETIFGLNILRRTDTLAGRKRWPERKPLLGKILRDAGASVYLLIETDSTTRKDMASELGSNFTYWGFKYYGIFWDTRVWERQGVAINETLFRDKNNRWLLSLPLVHEKSGKTITFDVTHLENDGDPGSDGHKSRFVETTHLAQLAKTGRRVGFFDCNSTTPVMSKPNSRQAEKPRNVLARLVGAKFLTSLGPAKVKNLSYGSHHGGKGGSKGPLIDDAWVVGDVEIVDGEIIRTDGTDASDHNGLKFRIRF